MATNLPTITVNGTQVLNNDLIELGLEIAHGRGSTDTQPDAPTATFTYSQDVLPFTIGATITIDLEVPVGGENATWGDPVATWGARWVSWNGYTLGVVRRFNGVVETLTAEEENGVVVRWVVGCIGSQARMGTTPIDLTRPQETEQARAAAIATAAGVTLTFLGTSTVQVGANTIQTDALSALHELASWTGALVWQGRDGTMFYGFADHRVTDPTQTLPSTAILDGVQWDSGMDDVLNHVVIVWGPNATPTQNTYRDDASIAAWGYRHVEQTTELVVESDVDEFGNTILVRRSDPFWSMPGVLLNSQDCTDDQWGAVNHLEVGQGVLVEVPTVPGPVGETPTSWTVEGWVERWDEPWPNQTFQFYLSDRNRWGAYALRTWTEMATQPWSHWATQTWLETLTAQ